MEPSHNKQLVKGVFEEFFNAHDISSADRYLHPDYIQHDYDVPPGREGFKESFARIFEIFPNFHVEIKHIIEEGDMIAMHGAVGACPDNASDSLYVWRRLCYNRFGKRGSGSRR